MAAVIKRLTLPAVLTAALSFSTVALAKDEPLSSVADLRYGVTLYHYYQQDYFQALSELYHADTKGGIQGHGDNPEIIRGGLGLAFGMQGTASDLFTELLDESRPAKVRNTAWYYLSKLAYNQQLWASANESLAKVERNTSSRVMARQADALAVNLMIRQGQLNEAKSALADWQDSSNWPTYLSYNLGSAFAREGDYSQAVAAFLGVFQAPLTEDSAEIDLQLALRDHARTGAGYAYLANQQFSEAYNQFNSVRLTDGELSHQALLGRGWAAFNLEDYQQALASWQALARRDFLYPEVQEASLAIPYTFEQMAAPGQALLTYLDSETAYEQELVRIEEAVTLLADANLLALLDVDVDRNSSWLSMPEFIEPPVIGYLRKVVARNHFQSRVQELRDLTALQEHLDEWRIKLSHYDHLQQARIDNRIEQSKQLAEADYDALISQLSRRRDRLASRIERVVSEQDYLVISTDDPDLIERAERALATSRLDHERIRPRQKAQAKLLKGILLWQAAQNYHDNLWALESELNQVNKTLADLEATYGRLQRAVGSAPDLEPMTQRLGAMNERVASQYQDLDRVMTAVTENLRGELLAELELQRKRIVFFLGESRLAIARLYDSQSEAASLLPSGEDEPVAQENTPEIGEQNSGEPLSDMDNDGGGQ